MACYHRFIFKHRNDEFDLFPNWPIDYLFIGTFNPEWDNPNGNNADYFYARSKYFWQTLSIFFTGMPTAPVTLQEKVSFAQEHRIGFTDIVKGVLNADYNNPEHRRRIFSFKDSDLELFGLENLALNTHCIQDFIQTFIPQKVFFTLLSGDPNTIISQNISILEGFTQALDIPTVRLHSPTGQGLGKGVPRLHKLLERWNIHEMLPNIDLAIYPYEV
jgi:hypothetical protein